ncbi:MAG: glutamine--fructose-6-phosphate transaminase (isomerizing) [Gammaproteobacteria bacterium]|jgi:glucosamine--fructose-6-phosphate aminotransferase (isomerizing)|nr:glutamine--fructose-6-phosphate transaminase (isomerizing) [Gammaproteobacteria bacterium]MBT6701116.1 glutamine--fructose-6-phosphate transaminase (isomerizing) [Gammaproteobacteria bacterium]MBT7045663.1 glutamine--fructose-6-phosphate transaminase (isomerizing) [Gammaproteobacteria bacterium]
MCGIVGALAQRDVSSILVEGLRRLEYRGYDSAGIAVINDSGLERFRSLGKVQQMANKIPDNQHGRIGIAHTRWATHGEPSEQNAHPHFSNDRIAVVHNGIIENYKELREELKSSGYIFSSETDTEVIAHLVDSCYTDNLLRAVQQATAKLEGAYALAIIALDSADELVACRKGSPLVLGIGFEENFVASDVSALLPVTSRFLYLEEGDFAVLKGKGYQVYGSDGLEKELDINVSELTSDSVNKGKFRHFMLKEIYEQASAISDCLEGRITDSDVLDAIFGPGSDEIFSKVENIQIIACGTSYHAGYVAKYWLEDILSIPCQIEVASEFRYRKAVVPKNTLFVTLSQSGETADTLAALRDIEGKNYCGSLSICNVPESSLVRESDLVLMTRAGPEIGVASTKAFTTQLVAMILMVITIGKTKGMDAALLKEIVTELNELPGKVESLFKLDEKIKIVAEDFIDKNDALFLGRGEHYPIAMEGALKLKEISYIHAEAYPAGELKHGPLALVDADMPIIVVTPNDELLEKLHSNMQEVKARGGRLYVFAHKGVSINEDSDDVVIGMKCTAKWTTPILSTIPLQLLSYHVAVQRGTDVDQPRNLAKSVTVE